MTDTPPDQQFAPSKIVLSAGAGAVLGIVLSLIIARWWHTNVGVEDLVSGFGLLGVVSTAIGLSVGLIVSQITTQLHAWRIAVLTMLSTPVLTVLFLVLVYALAPRWDSYLQQAAGFVLAVPIAATMSARFVDRSHVVLHGDDHPTPTNS